MADEHYYEGHASGPTSLWQTWKLHGHSLSESWSSKRPEQTVADALAVITLVDIADSLRRIAISLESARAVPSPEPSGASEK